MQSNIIDEYIGANVLQIVEVIKDLKYKKGWSFSVIKNTFLIRIECEDSIGRPQFMNFSPSSYVDDYCGYSAFRREITRIDDQPKQFWVMHNFPIDPLPRNREETERWILERIIEVETHEAMEFFKVNGEAVYFPDHTPGGNPYSIERK